MTVHAILTVDGADVSCYTVADIRATVGRDSVYDQPQPGTLNAVLVQDTVTGPTDIQLGRTVELWVSTRGAPHAAWADAAVVWAATDTSWDGYAWADPDWRLFTGPITDVTAELAADGRWAVNVTAAGILAELARTPVGDEPWPAETDSQRIRRILTLTGYDTTGVPDVFGPQVLARDVDRTAADKLLTETASDGSGLLWEDHSNDRVAYQANLYRDITPGASWDQNPDTWDTATYPWDSGGGNPNEPYPVDMCAVLADPWTYTAKVGSYVTWCEVKYGEPQAVVTAGDRTPPVYGRSITTRLVSSADAQAMADRLVYTRGHPRYDAPSMVLVPDRLPTDDFAALPAFITGGRAITADPLPPGSPYMSLTGFLEGWEHRFAADTAGQLRWSIRLTVSEASLTAPFTLWDTADPLTWDTLAPADVWNQPRLTGAAVTDRWEDSYA